VFRPLRGASQRQQGLSMIELIFAIVILSVGLVALLVPITSAIKNSADPVVAKQAVAVAEAMLEEIELQPFNIPTGSTCNPCAATQANRASFDHISNYDGFSSAAVCRIDDTTCASPILQNYSILVSATHPPGPLGAVPAANAYLIAVTVTASNNVQVTLSSYRTSYY
jgi:MSHA pilin protein MshD